MAFSRSDRLHLKVFFLAYFISRTIFGATATTSISLGSSFLNNQTLQSANGLFELGFFTIPLGSPSSVYFGIWYASIQPLTSVWVANRQQPVSHSASFSLSSDGVFSVVDRSKTVWSTDSRGLNVSLAILLDTGNFVLETANSTIVWQSFDHPGDTWLPTMSLGPNIKLRSWLTPTDPSPGPYSLEMAQGIEEFVSVWNDSRQYWSSGLWTGKIFTNVPEMTTGFIYNFNMSNTSGFYWTIYPNVGVDFNISRFIIQTNGQIEQWSYIPGRGWNNYWFQPKDACSVTGECGNYGICGQSLPNCNCPGKGFQPANPAEWPDVSIHGCVRQSSLNCSSQGSNDGFFPVNQTSYDLDSAATLSTSDESQCGNLCLKNCSCTAFAFDSAARNCSLFTTPLFNGQSSSSSSPAFYIRVAAKDLISEQSTAKKKLSAGMIAGVTVASATMFVVIVLACVTCLRRRKQRRGATASREEYGAVGLRVFTYGELQAATKNFKDKIGSGGFGTVFRGVVAAAKGAEEPQKVAVKMLARLDQGEKQFRAEVKTIGTIQHVNLVRLLGFCSEGNHRLLVYELAENGSVDGAVFARSAAGTPLNWRRRFNIALGAARAVAYLHDSCRECIIHCDIKPENILLDADYAPKVADFGLAKLVGREFSRVLTTMRGTRGYLAPEWIAGLAITAKADVYSFGMTLLELVSGRRNIDYSSVDVAFFPVWAAELINQANADLTCLVDSRLQGDVDMDELQRVVHCAIWCIQDKEERRPSMSKAIQILEGTMQVNAPPIPTSLQYLIEDGDTDSSHVSIFSHSNEEKKVLKV